MTTGRERILRWTVRLVLLAAAVAFAGIGWFPSSVARALPPGLSRLFPSMSPLMALGGAAGGRRWVFGILWALPGLVLLATAVFRGRFFCRWICPAGTLYSIPRRAGAKKRLLRSRLGGYLFWATVGASLAGAPFLLFLDPLATFGRTATPAPYLSLMTKGAYSAAIWVPAFLIPLFLLIGFAQPMIWCERLCPLGYTFDLALLVRRHRHVAFDRSRREIVRGLAIGVPLALALRRFGLPSASASEPRFPVLPPGARDPNTFSVLCTRCYTCVNVCPTQVLRVPYPGDRKFGQWFQPELDTVASYCDEFCTKCSEVCPVGAIAPLSKEIKHRTRIGLAQIAKADCLSWSYGQHCMVCAEYCPYRAIDTVKSDKGIPQPVVNLDKCRGCGSCQYACPSGDGEKQRAIVVHGVATQTQVPEQAPKPAPRESGEAML